MAHKIEIAADLTQPYTPPADANIETLRELAQSAQAAAIALLDGDNPSDEDIAKANWLASAIDTANVAADSLQASEDERKQSIEALKGRFQPTEPTETDDAVPAAPAEETIPEPVLAAGGPVTVPSLADIARTVGAPKIEARRRNVTLTAAADVPGFANGSELRPDQLGEAFEARARGYAGMAGRDGKSSANFASIHIDFDDALVASGASGDRFIDVTGVLDAAADEGNLAGGSLVAAGGWCAPSETLYDLLNMSTSEGLISVPEISASRGGLKWATGPDFGAVYANGGMFTLTEAQAISGATKPVFDIPCPSFTESRMNADGMYLTGDILSQRGYPEAISDYITKAQIAWQHYVSGKTIIDMVTGSVAVDMSSAAIQADFGATPNVLGALALQVEDMKYRGRLSRGQSVEVVLPYFARSIIRSDIAKRQGLSPDEFTISDAQIDALFTNLGVNPQFVYDWQDNIVSGGTANPFGGESTPASTWPQKFKALLYPAGTWARALTPVIELSTVYDSTLLTTNQYVALFTEQGRLTIKRGFDSRVVTLASNPSGLTSGFVAQTTPAPTPV